MSSLFAQVLIDWQDDPVTPTEKTMLELLKEYLGICQNDTSRDPALELALEVIGRQAEAYINNVIAPRDVSEQYRNKQYPIALRYWPVRSVTTVTVNGEDLTDQYTVYAEDGVTYITPHRTGASYPRMFDQLLIDYQAGYDKIPVDLAGALVRAAVAYDKEVLQGTEGPVKKESVVGVGSVEYDLTKSSGGFMGPHTQFGELPAATVAVLDLYRRWHA